MIRLPTEPDAQWWVALVDFIEHPNRIQPFEVIPDDCEGCVGWIALRVGIGETPQTVAERDLGDAGLRVVSLEHERKVNNTEEINNIDPHLAENCAGIEPSDTSVWGGLNCYIGEGEA